MVRPAGVVLTGNEAEGCASGCCAGSAIQVPAIRGNHTITSAQCSSEDCNDSLSMAVPAPVKEELVTDGCTGVWCTEKPVSVAVEESQADNCDNGCCGTTNEAPIEACKDDYSGGVKPEEAQESKGEM